MDDAPDFPHRLGELWRRTGFTILRLSIAVMAGFALLKLGSEFYRLIWEPSWLGAIDLKMRHREVHAWFTGMPVYHKIEMAVYPPASHVILWPFFGWLSLTAARWFWACTTLAALAWLSHLAVDNSKADNRVEQILVVLMILSMNATGVVIGNGQLGIHLLPVLVAGILFIARKQGTWSMDLLGGGLVLFSLVKPNMTAPFFWLVLFVPGRIRPALLIVFGYLILTLYAASFQQADIVQLFRSWLEWSVKYTEEYGYANLHMFLYRLGWEEWSLKASCLVLAAHGYWVFRQRHADIWILLGVTAIVSRLWAYHGLYDNVLILIPMVALFRIAKTKNTRPGNSHNLVAGLLIAVNIITLLAPARMHFVWPKPIPQLFEATHLLAWTATLIFLLYFVHRASKGRPTLKSG